MTRHYIGGVQVQQPEGWDGTSMELVRDLRKRIVYPRYPAAITFAGDGYNTLRGLFLTRLCGITTYEVYEQCGGVFQKVIEARIVLSDLEFNLTRCTVEASLVDDGIGARILNNFKVPVRPTAEATKNSTAAAACAVTTIEVYDPQAAVGAYLADPRDGYDWLDAIRHAVRYITDSDITIQSDWYTSLPDDERYLIALGYELRTFTPTSEFLPEYSFEQLFMEMSKKYNLWLFLLRAPDGTPTVRIEPEDYAFGTTVLATLPHQMDLVQAVDTEQLPASVKVGSESGIKVFVPTTALSLPYLVMQGQTEEFFHFDGECNTDAEVDLVNKWNICSNVIEQCIVGGDDEYDDKLFLIQYDRSTMRAVKGEYFNAGTTPYLYNPALLNGEVLGRYNWPQAVGAIAGNPAGNAFIAGGTVVQNTILMVDSGTTYDTPTPGTLELGAVIFDPGGNFDPVTGTYEAPGQGYYEFEFRYTFSFIDRSDPPPLVEAFVRWSRFDSANNLLHSYEQLVGVFGAVPDEVDFTRFSTFGTVLDPTDYVRVDLRWRVTGTISPLGSQFVRVRIRANRRLRSTFIAVGGGFIEGGDVRIIKYSFERQLPVALWRALLNDPRGAVQVSDTAGNLRTCHLLRITRTFGDGDATIELIAPLSEPL